MYRHINRHIDSLLRLLRDNTHVRDYDNLMHAFAQPDAPVDRVFQGHYAHFWGFHQGLNRTWREHYFTQLQNIRNQGEDDLRQLLRCVCHETSNNHRGGESLQFAFATKLVHTVTPVSPIYDANVRAFYFLPDANGGGDIEARMGRCLEVYDALVREYERILKNRLLDKSIALFREKLHPETFTDIKVIDSLIWAFVTWAGRGPGFLQGELQFE